MSWLYLLQIGKNPGVMVVRHGCRQLHTYCSTSVTDRHGSTFSCPNLKVALTIYPMYVRLLPGHVLLVESRLLMPR